MDGPASVIEEGKLAAEIATQAAKILGAPAAVSGVIAAPTWLPSALDAVNEAQNK